MRKSTDEEKKAFLSGINNYLVKRREGQEGFNLLILGVLVGIIGSFIANLFYKISEDMDVFYFWLINSLIIIIFLILIIVIIIRYYSYFKEIREFEKYRGEIFKRGLMINSNEPLL